MNKLLNKPIVIITLIVIFFVLTLIASYHYSNNEEGREKIRQSFLFKSADWGLEQGEKIIFQQTDSISSSTAETEEGGLVDSPEELANDLKKYINIKKIDNGVTIILQNSGGIFWEKTWQILPPQVETEINQ